MKHKITLLSLLLPLLAACGQSSLETTFASQSTKIDAYVTKQLESHPEYRVAYTTKMCWRETGMKTDARAHTTKRKKETICFRIQMRGNTKPHIMIWAKT